MNSWPPPKSDYVPQIGDLLEIPMWNSHTMYTMRKAWPHWQPTSLEICEVVGFDSMRMVLAIPKICGGLEARHYKLSHLDKAKCLQHSFCDFNKDAFVRKVEGRW